MKAVPQILREGGCWMLRGPAPRPSRTKNSTWTWRHSTGAESIKSFLKRRKWSWAGHLLRRNDGRWTRELTFWWPRGDGKRARGGQRRRWRDDFKHISNWTRKAADREKCLPTPIRRRSTPSGRPASTPRRATPTATPTTNSSPSQGGGQHPQDGRNIWPT